MSSDGSLSALIPNIQGITRDLLDFQPYVPSARQTIPALVSELYAIVAFLREVQEVSRDSRNRRYCQEYQGHLRSLVLALSRTLKDLEIHIDNRDRIGGSRAVAYPIIWEDIHHYFIEQSNNSLLDRIGCFKRFLQELIPILEGDYETNEFDILHQRIHRLLDFQDEDALESELRQLRIQQDALHYATIDADLRRPRSPSPEIRAPPLKQKSWERTRSGFPPPPIVPEAPPAAPNYGAGPTSPLSPPGSGRLYTQPPEPVRPPSPPASSVISGPASSVGTAPSVAGSDMGNKHWLRRAIDQKPPTTIFDVTGLQSNLFADHQSGVSESLRKRDYHKLWVVPFDNNVEVIFWIREKDNKVQVYCKREKNDRKRVACRALSDLYIFRAESNLKLCTAGKKKNQFEMMAILNFKSYERLCMFFCTFLGLKKDDCSIPKLKLDDHVMKGEKHIFSANIVDDNYRHALQIYKDECSHGIRLQASIQEKSVQRAPAWTAFINYRIGSRKWSKQVESKKIHLLDLPRHVWVSDYTPHDGPNGEPELFFDRAEDAKKFMKVIDDLAEGHYD